MWLYPALFLCGVKYAATRFSADQPVGHTLDDGLNEAAKRALVVLIRSAKSREMKQLLKSAGWQLEGSEYVALRFAYRELEDEIPPTVSKWLQHGNEQENRCRLAIGMGARAPFDLRGFAFMRKLRHASFVFVNGENKDCGNEVKAIVERFFLTRHGPCRSSWRWTTDSAFDCHGQRIENGSWDSGKLISLSPTWPSLIPRQKPFRNTRLSSLAVYIPSTQSSRLRFEVFG